MTSFSLPSLAAIVPDPIPWWMWVLLVFFIVMTVVVFWLKLNRPGTRAYKKTTSVKNRYLASFLLGGVVGLVLLALALMVLAGAEIGRASCRERV